MIDSKMLEAISKASKNRRIFNSMDCSIEYQALYKESCDWHKFSSALDFLSRNGFIKHSGIDNGGRNRYEMK